MQDLDQGKAISVLRTIMEFELAGVVRYTHYALMITGPNRIPIVAFFTADRSSMFPRRALDPRRPSA